MNDIWKVPNTDMIHILYVNNDKRFSENFKKYLEKQGEYKIETASSFSEALLTICKKKHDIIISEYDIPQKNGLILLKELRDVGDTTPFIFFTSTLSKKDTIKALNLEVNYIITRKGGHKKVFTNLIEAIRKVVRKKRQEEAIQKSEERLRTLIDNADNISFITTDLSGKEPRILDFSKGAERIFGYTSEEAIGKPVSILHTPEDVAKFPQEFKSLKEGKKGFNGETILVRKSGERFHALFSTYPLFNKKRKLIATFGTSIDITEYKQREEALKEKIKSMEKLLQKEKK